jgi:agmatinase
MLAKQNPPFIGCECDYNAADIVLFGAPFDGTTSYRPGARFGGKTIRAESYGLETYSPYLNRDLSDIRVFDGGELELPFGNTERVLGMIYAVQQQILADGKIPVMLGGEHLITLAAVRAAIEKHPGLTILHFDAHADLREEYLGEQLSHACVMRRCWELLGDNRIYSYGIRSGAREEFEWAKEHICLKGTKKAVHLFSEQEIGAARGKPVYLTIDLDVLDPSEFPATGTPEAGGITFEELRRAIESYCAEFSVVGCDLVEYAPPYDANGVCAATAGKILRELLLSLRTGVKP